MSWQPPHLGRAQYFRKFLTPREKVGCRREKVMKGSVNMHCVTLVGGTQFTLYSDTVNEHMGAGKVQRRGAQAFVLN